MKIKNTKYVGGLLKIADEYLPTGMMLGSILGIGVSLYFAYKKAKDTGEENESYELEKRLIQESGTLTDEEKKKNLLELRILHGVKVVAINKWAIASAVAAGGMSFGSNFLNGRKIAGLAAALALSEDKLKKVYGKAKEFMGTDEYKKFVGKIAEDDIHEQYGDDDPPWDVDDEQPKHFYDMYFGCTREVPEDKVRSAIAQAKHMTFLRANEWLSMLGEPTAPVGHRLGWGPKNRFDAHIEEIYIEGHKMKSIVYDTFPVGLSMRKNHENKGKETKQ